MPISEPTAVFSIRDDRDMEIKQAVLQVYRALEEKGYNPINQLVGYILSEDPTYITTYKNARAIIRRIDRDMAYEEELMALVRDFWENHVLTKTPPPYVEADGDLILESLRRKLGPADKDAPPVLLGQTQFGQLSMILSLQEQKKALSADVSKLEKDIKRLKGMLIERMGTSCTAVYNGPTESYTVTYNPVRSAGISKDALERLKDEHPDIYDQYVTVSEWRRFHVKKAALQAA